MQRFRNAVTPSSSWKKCGALFVNPDWNAIHIYIFSCIVKVQIKSSKQSTSASLHRHHLREGKNLLKIKCTKYFKNKSQTSWQLFLAFNTRYAMLKRRNAAYNSLHIYECFRNCLIFSITKSNFLFICVSGPIKLKQWLLNASKVFLFFHSFLMFPAFQVDFS